MLSAATWPQDLELDEVLEIFWGNAQDRARLLQFQFDSFHR
jgi:hypothetical protein